MLTKPKTCALLGFDGVTVAPALRMPKNAISNSTQLGARMPTKSPLATPMSTSATARRSA